MPIVELPTLSYDDIDKDPHRLIDKLSDTLRQLDWLLNKGRLDAQNINQTAIQIQLPNQEQVVDPHGVNPIYLDYYPNKCYNSSFEVFDSATRRPYYWNTNGDVSEDANFDNTFSLKLAPGQYVEQREENGAGLADPAWWPWCNGKTRIALYAKGEGGKVRVSVWQGGATVPLAYWTKDADGKDKEVQTSPPHYLGFNAGLDWPNSLITFAALPSVSGGKIKLRIDNVGSVDVYIDSVIIRADWTGKWPGLYKHGPKSVYGEAAVIEYKRVPYQQDVTIYFSKSYPYPPVVTAGIEYEGAPSSYTMTPHIRLIKQLQAGIEWYTGVEVTWAGGPSSISGAYTTMIAVCRE